MGALEAFMSLMFREGHNKPRPRLREPLRLGPPPKPMLKRTSVIALAAAAAVLLAAGWAYSAKAHPGAEAHSHILKAPIAGVLNNYWYDYRSDVEEAENELRKDLRRAKTAQDRREALGEYNRELVDAKKDYRKEMVEKGYILRRQGEVTVGG
jgi:hypothetical protein